ncbi:hypothetical protein [Nocardia rhamnosiphila]
MLALFQPPPLRMELPEDAYTGVPACWWSRRRWVALNMALYDLLYPKLRATLRAPSVSRNTYQAWVIAESRCADIVTGRDCRPSVRHLSQRIARHPRTVKRCRQLAGLLDTRQVVFRGRQRTKRERLDSWNRGDRARGWTAVAALIDSPAYAHLVDNSTLELLLQQDFVTPLPRSGGSLSLSPPKSVQSHQNVIERRAPRRKDTKERVRKPRNYDQKALLLGARIRSDERFPLWLRRLGVQGLAAVLTKRARAGWLADDVHAALDDVWAGGTKVFDSPRDPYAYLAWLLSRTPVDAPPALYERACEAQLEMARRTRIQKQSQRRRAEALAATPAAQDSPARTEAMAAAAVLGQKAVSGAAVRRAGQRAARQELARQARKAE